MKINDIITKNIQFEYQSIRESIRSSFNPRRSGYHARAFQPDVCVADVSFLYFDAAPESDGSWC